MATLILEAFGKLSESDDHPTIDTKENDLYTISV